MADETVDFITELNEEDPTSYVYEDRDYDSNLELYEPAVSLIKQEDEFEEFPFEEGVAEDVGELVADPVDEIGNAAESTNHNLILKEIINELGYKVESYFCQECNVEYSNINDFLNQHPGVELLNENPEEETMPESNSTQDKLWDLVEDLRDDEPEESCENITGENEVIQDEGQDLGTIEKSEPPEDNDRYYCYECQQVFTDLTTAEQHDCTQSQQQEENEDNTKGEGQEDVDFVCAYCSQIYFSYDDLLNHLPNCQQKVTDNCIPTSTKPITYHCELCNKNYSSIRSYNNHQRLHKKSDGEKIPTTLGPIICEICNTRFASPKNLRLHMKMHDERSLKTIQEALPAGAQKEYNELNQFFCEICNKSFDQRLLAIHKNMHQNVEEYNCSRCNKQFENLLSYEMHMQMHAENNVFSMKKTSDPKEAINSGGTTKKHQCQYCGKEFQRPYEKVKHERIHTGEKPYNCEVCGKSFRVSYSLTLHLRTHTDIRPYVCATCNKRFKQQSVYVHHLKTHVAERQYKCDICGKSFRTSVQLCGHKNSHKKPFNCTECNRPFASLYAVKIHMKTHNKSHKSNKNLKNRCEICGASYARIFALRYHLKEQHGLDVDPGQLLSSEYTITSSPSMHKGMDAETAILMNAACEAQLGEFMDDSDDNEEDFKDRQENGKQSENQIIMQHHDEDDLDETAAATQTILQENEEIIEDNFHTEEIITQW